MSGFVNRVTLFGFMTRDPELIHIAASRRIALLTLSTPDEANGTLNDLDIDPDQEHCVVIADESLIDLVERHLRKGAKVYIEGLLSMHAWTDAAGQEIAQTEVIVGAPSGKLIVLDTV